MYSLQLRHLVDVLELILEKRPGRERRGQTNGQRRELPQQRVFILIEKNFAFDLSCELNSFSESLLARAKNLSVKELRDVLASAADIRVTDRHANRAKTRMAS